MRYKDRGKLSIIMTFLIFLFAISTVSANSKLDKKITFFSADFFSIKGTEKIIDTIIYNELDIFHGILLVNSVNKLKLQYDWLWKIKKSLILSFKNQYIYDLFKYYKMPNLDLNTQLSIQMGSEANFFIKSRVLNFQYISTMKSVEISLGMKIFLSHKNPQAHFN